MYTPSRGEMTPIGICIGVCIVLIALLLGGLYLWGAMLSGDVKPEDRAAGATTTNTIEQNADPAGERIRNDMIDGALAP